jgi:hypothetical protein
VNLYARAGCGIKGKSRPRSLGIRRGRAGWRRAAPRGRAGPWPGG